MLGLERGNSLSNMTMQMKYISLREEFLSVVQTIINGSMLQVLKEYYAQHIDSNRKLSQIKDLRALLKVLEKRDCLSYSNIEPLFYISSTILNDFQIENKLKDYQINLQNIQSFPLINMYQSAGVSEEKNEAELSNVTEDISKLKLPANNSKYQASQTYVESHKISLEQNVTSQQKLLLQISERIGRSWRDTARYLGVPEYQIDAIQNKYPCDLREQSFEVLKLYIFQYNTNSWELNLIHALEKARRRDLKELVENYIINKDKD